jgi:hypothetical protein
MKQLLATGLLGLAAVISTTSAATAGTFGLIPHSWCCGCKCGCLVRPYNAFTPAMCCLPPCIDNAFPNPAGCYAGPGGCALGEGLPPAYGYQCPTCFAPGYQDPYGMAYQGLPATGYYAGGAYTVMPSQSVPQPVATDLQPAPVKPAGLQP